MSARRLTGVAGSLLLTLAALPLALTGAATSAGAAPAAAKAESKAEAKAEAEEPAYTQTKQLTRSIVFDGQPIEVDARAVTVTASRTTELRGRERIEIAWSGAHPTGGRSASPFGELAMLQEYPVVILQCRGVDDPSLPPEQQLSPETCWTSSRLQRSQMVDDSQAVWRHDVHATEVDVAQKSGLAPIPVECNDPANFSTHVTPFRAANGTVHAACSAETMPPEAAVGAAFPPAEMAAFTDAQGNGRVKFEVRTAVENESLGCSDTVACSIVVIPIMGISCRDADGECSKAGRFLEGSSNFANEGVDMAVSPQLWWSASNWRNRFTIPLTFGLAPDACDVLDSRPPVGFYGSELMSQASLQWSPAYCLDKKRFKFQHNKMSDDAGFNLAQTGGGVAAFVSSKHDTEGGVPVAYAPTAVTGFSIAYVIDRPDNAGELLELNLTPRLVAKLMTQSYLGSERGRGHPGMSANPLSINTDPEFQELNPGLDTVPREAGAVLLSLSESSDVLTTLTSWIARDEDAMDFIKGKKDPWGMSVNPSYEDIELPTSEWPLLDDYVPPSELECYQQNPAPYFTQLAAPVTSLRKIADAVLDSWPNVQTKCERPSLTDPWKIGRVDRQGVGSRFMLGLVATADARRLGLNEARLQTTGSTFVAPTDAALGRAVKAAEPGESGTDPFVLDMDAVVKAGGYPGTMVVYTAARTAELPQADADVVAQFIEVATSEGQRTGHGNGELPEGYLPLAKSGPTAPLWRQAQAAAEAIAAQEGVTDDGSDPSDDGAEETTDEGSSTGSGTGSTDMGPGSVTSVDEVPATEEDVAPEKTRKKKEKEPTDASVEEEAPVAMPDTVAVSSPLASRTLPALVSVVLLGALLSAGLHLLLLLRRRHG